MPQTPIPGKGYGAPPQTPLLGAPAFRAYRASLGAFGPSIVPNQKSRIHHWAHPPSENPGYGGASHALFDKVMFCHRIYSQLCG